MSTEQKDYNLSPKEFAHLVGVSSSTVRRWEEEKVFTSVRTPSGYRKFALSDVPKAKEYKNQVNAIKKQKSQEHIYSITSKQAIQKHNYPVVDFIFKRAAVLSLAVLLMIVTAAAVATYPAVKSIMSDRYQAKSEKTLGEKEGNISETDDMNVLAAESSRLARSIISNIGWDFRSTVKIEDLQVNGPSVFLDDIDARGQNLDLGTGRITASNVLYGVEAGKGISIAGTTQSPLITNIDPGSAQEIFKNIKVGSNTITASSNTDTLTFEQGSGITLTVDGKKVTIASSQSGYSYWTTEVDGVSYDNIEDGSSVNFVSGDDITVTRSAANELTFNLQDVIDTVTGIDLTAGGYLTGTNATITFDNFSVDASGNIRIAAGSDFYIGNVQLGSIGSSSGASLIGVDGTNISQSASGDLQTVLENMSAAMGSGSSKWTIASDVIYPNNYSTADFSLGGTTPASSPFGIDIDQNILYLGDGANDANTPSLYFKASDGSNWGTLSYSDSDRFVFSGGDVVVDGVIYAGSGTQQITLANGMLNPNALPLITSGTSPTTSSVSGFEILSNQIGLIRGCSNGEVLKWNSTTSRWTCSPDSSGVSGVVDVQQDGSIPAGSADSQFDTINFVNNFNLSENSSGVIDVDLASNIGIGTAPSGSYALTVNGATNTSTLYLSGTQVTASANEINLLTGRTGTLLDTNNVATQLSAWDQNASDDVTAFTGLSDTPSSYSGQAARVVRVNAGGTGLEFVDPATLGTNYWGRNSGSGYVYPSVVTDRVGIGTSTPTQMLDVQGNIAVSGTVDGRDVSADGSNLDTLYTTIGLSALTSGEVDQLENIGATTISSTQWGYLGSLNQSVSTTDAVTFTTINTGQGAYELYAMDQNVRTSDTVQFAGLQIGGATPNITSIVSGTGTDWSGAVDTALATQLSIKSYVDAQIGGAAYTFENGISESGNTVTLGGALNQSTRLYDGSYEYLYMNTSTGNVGIGTTTTSTYKLNVSGSLNASSLYLTGSQVTSNASELNLLDGVSLTLTAGEFNLLDGRSGTLLDTNNVATQLSAWDQDSSNDLITTDIGVTVQGYNANTSFLGQTIESSEITDGTITTSDFASTLTFASGAFLDLSSIDYGSTAPQGLRLPNATSANLASNNPSVGEGYLAYDTDVNKVKIFNGSSWTDISGASTTLQEAYEAGNSILMNAGQGNIRISNDGSNELLFLDEATGYVGIGNTAPGYKLDVSGDIRIASGSDLYIGTTALSSISGAGLIGVDSSSISSSSASDLQSVLEDLDSAIGGVGNSSISAVGNITSGDAFTSGTPGSELYFTSSGVLGLGNTASSAARIEFFNDTIDRISLLSSYVGIGTTAPVAALDVQGAIRLGASGGISDTLNTISAGTAPSASLYWGSYRICTTGDSCAGGAGGGVDSTGGTGYLAKFTDQYNVENSILYESGGNIGIGTTVTGTYKVNVSGSLNTTTLYLAGTQVNATATEINLLSGRSGTLLDTSNVATQLSAWDQDSSNDLITTDIGSTVQGYNANTSFLGQTIETGEITDGSVLPADVDDNGQTPGDGQVLTYNNSNSKFNWVDATSLGTNYWGRNSGSGYVYPAVVTDRVGIGNTAPTEELDVTGDIAVSGTVDGRDISADGSSLDTLYTTIGLSALTSGEVDQLENIGAATISTSQWGYLGAMNQSVATTDAVTFTTINTGQGANELYAMDQNVRTSDTVQFAGLQIGGTTPSITSIVSGTGTDWSGAADTALATQLAIKSYVDNEIAGVTIDVFTTFTADSGSTTANTAGDTLTINGSGSITTSISGDTLTITGTDNDTTYSAGSGLSLASTTFSLGGAISQPTRLYDGSYEYLYINNSTGNLGIGTTSTGTYKLNVGGSLNASSLYLGDTQVTSTASELNLLDGVNLTLTASEFNLLDGRSGTLLDTNNVATQLSACIKQQ
ncbi:MerR family DNA-binding transcriptional regulator [Candidatus Roizmanbacteria bacterium]|nr:MAG: MerR family DNA-binding transcriptional regulator [Candidatus Roizmanbacteria bacterium]